jgi:hypothetical protein
MKTPPAEAASFLDKLGNLNLSQRGKGADTAAAESLRRRRAMSTLLITVSILPLCFA